MGKIVKGKLGEVKLEIKGKKKVLRQTRKNFPLDTKDNLFRLDFPNKAVKIKKKKKK